MKSFKKLLNQVTTASGNMLDQAIQEADEWINEMIESWDDFAEDALLEALGQMEDTAAADEKYFIVATKYQANIIILADIMQSAIDAHF